MDELRKDELTALLEQHTGRCVSLFMPTHRAGAETRQDPIRLKNLLRVAEEKLAATGMRPLEVKDYLEPICRLERDQFFWRQQDHGLAIFLCGSEFRHYRLPYEFEETVEVADHFHLRPLLPLFQNEGEYYLLALSKNHTRIFKGNQFGLEEFNVETLPTSLSEVLKYYEFEQNLQFHTGTTGMGGGDKHVSQNFGGGPAGGDRRGMFHGHGGSDADDNYLLLEYFRAINKGLHELLKEERVPLVLAGVEYLFAIYRDANTYRHLVGEGVTGSVDSLKPGALHHRAWAVVRPHFEKQQRDAVAQFQNLQNSGRVSTDTKDIVPAAVQGRVECLFVQKGAQQWGEYDVETGQVRMVSQPTNGTKDLPEFAAAQTFLQGGSVYALPPEQMPAPTPLAAIFRYAL